MTATDLYEIVRDVPREAWPFHPACFLKYDNGNVDLFTLPPMDGRERKRPASEAELMFVGSMIIHLAKRGFFPTCNVWDDGKNPRASVLINNQQMSHGGSSLVAAIAAACKEVGE